VKEKMGVLSPAEMKKKIKKIKVGEVDKVKVKKRGGKMKKAKKEK